MGIEVSLIVSQQVLFFTIPTLVIHFYCSYDWLLAESLTAEQYPGQKAHNCLRGHCKNIGREFPQTKYFNLELILKNAKMVPIV